jgi:hypothetical protein
MKEFAIREHETLKAKPALYPCETCPPNDVVKPIWWPIEV